MMTFLDRNTVGVLGRILVALIVGYFLAMATCLWLAHFLDLPAREARLLTNMLFFVFHALIALWAFSPSSHLRAVVSISATTVVVWGLWWLTGGSAV